MLLKDVSFFRRVNSKKKKRSAFIEAKIEYEKRSEEKKKRREVRSKLKIYLGTNTLNHVPAMTFLSLPLAAKASLDNFHFLDHLH